VTASSLSYRHRTVAKARKLQIRQRNMSAHGDMIIEKRAFRCLWHDPARQEPVPVKSPHDGAGGEKTLARLVQRRV
jgi:hypothetical protein